MKKTNGFIIKTLLAVIGTICFCVGFLFVFSNSVASYAAGSFTLKSISAYNVRENIGDYYVAVKTDTDLSSVGTAKVNSIIDKNGTKSACDIYVNAVYDEGTTSLQVPFDVVAKGETAFVTLPAGVEVGGYVLSQDFSIYIDNNAIYNVFDMKSSGQTGLVEGSVQAYTFDFDQEPLEGTTSANYYRGNTIYIISNFGKPNESRKEWETFQYVIGGDGKLYAKIWVDDMIGGKLRSEVNDLVLYIPKGGFVGQNEGRAVSGRDIYIYLNGDDIHEIIEYTDITFANSFNIRTDDYYIEFAGAPKNQEFKSAGNVSIEVNDESCSVGFYVDTNGKYGMVLPFEKAPKNKVNKVVVKAGSIVYENTKNLNDVTFYVSGYGVFSEKEAHTTTVNLSGAVEKSEKIWWDITNLNGLVDTASIERNGIKIYGYGYNPNPGDENSTEKLYETLAAVFKAEDGDYPNSVNVDVRAMLVKNVQGASIRLSSDYQGLRFTSEVDDVTDESIVDYGAYITTEAFLDKLDKDFTNITDGKDGNVISSSKGMSEFDDSKKQCKVYAAVIDVSPINYNKNFTACAFIKVKYESGLEKIILADNPIVRSAYKVATTAIADSLAGYTDTQKSYIQKYIDGVVDIDYNYQLIGAERSYTIEKVADGEIKVTAKDGTEFNVNGIKAFSIGGVRKSATFENGTIKFDASEIIVQKIADEVAAQGRSERRLQITSYFGPSLGIAMENGKLTGGVYRPSSVEDVKKYFDAGFDFLVADEADYEAYRAEGINFGSGSGVKDDAKRMLDLVALYCDVYGITDKKYAPVVIYDSVIWAVMDAEDIKVLNRTDKELEDLLVYHFNSLDGYRPEYPAGYKYKTNKTPLNCFSGFTLRDEPYGEDLDLYDKWYNFLASPDGIGMLEKGYYLVGAVISPGVNRQYLKGYENDDYTLATDKEYYEHYMKYVVENMKNNTADNSQQYLMTDCYPFLTELSCSVGKKISAKNVISEHYFGMMQTYAYNAKINGFKAATCIQITTHYNIDKYNAVMNPGLLDKKSYTLTGRINEKGEVTMNKNHVRYQSYMALAYGMQRIDYFTYWQHYNQTTTEKTEQVCVTWKYNAETNEYVAEYQPMYDWCKETNAEIKSIDEIVLAFDWLGTKLVSGKTTGDVYGDAISYDGNAAADSATSLYDLAVGCFTLGGVYDGYMLVNADDPSNGRANEVSINFGSEYSYAVRYDSGTTTVIPLNDGILDITLSSGDGVFVVPIK